MARDRTARLGQPRPNDAQVSRETCAPTHREPAAYPEAAAAKPDMLGSDTWPEDTRGRTANGRFRNGHSGNPRGRPRRPKATPDDVLAQLLDEELPNRIPGQAKRISMREALIRSLCVRGLKDPRIALSLIKLDANRRDTPDGGEELDLLLAEDEAALDAYLARERRRGSPRSRTEKGA